MALDLRDLLDKVDACVDEEEGVPRVLDFGDFLGERYADLDKLFTGCVDEEEGVPRVLDFGDFLGERYADLDNLFTGVFFLGVLLMRG